MPRGGRPTHINYVVPRIIIIAIASVAQGTAISVAVDMTEGIIAGSEPWHLPALGADRSRPRQHDPDGARIVVVIGVALAIGFRPTAGLVDGSPWSGSSRWSPPAMTCLRVALGLRAKSVKRRATSPCR